MQFNILTGGIDVVAYWSTLTFDGHPVVPIPVSCDGRPGDVFTSATYITDFLSSSIKDIRNGKHDKALDLFKFVTQHADRQKNEVIICKCQFISGKNPCNFCQKNPVQSQKSLDLVKAAGGMYEPTPSPSLEGHYMTFLEMINSKDRSDLRYLTKHYRAKPLESVKLVHHGSFHQLLKQKDISQYFIEIIKEMRCQA